MANAFAIRTLLLTSFTLLLHNSIVCGQDLAVPAVENQSVPASDSESTAISTKAMPAKALPAEKNVENSNAVKKQSGSEIKQARPGERVTNPDHSILNLDTTLGGVAVNGTDPNDYGYLGPGDMRTHLWNAHSKALIENGITENKLFAMTVPEVQKWHNHFHGVEGSPEHPHEDHEDGNIATAEQSTMPTSPTYGDDPFNETIIYENYGYDNAEYPQSIYSQPEIIYDQGVILEGYTR